MVDAKKVIKSLKHELSRMTPREREAYFKRMGLSFEQKTDSKSKDFVTITPNQGQHVVLACANRFAYHDVTFARKTNRTHASAKVQVCRGQPLCKKRKKEKSL